MRSFAALRMTGMVEKSGARIPLPRAPAPRTRRPVHDEAFAYLPCDFEINFLCSTATASGRLCCWSAWSLRPLPPQLTPDVAPSGTLAVISKPDTPLNARAAVPLKVTPVTPVRSVPKILMVAPTLPLRWNCGCESGAEDKHGHDYAGGVNRVRP
jgi:hypothetical protein